MSTKVKSSGSFYPDTSDEQIHIEDIGSLSRIPENSNYYQKGGLRIEGNGVDHSNYNTHSIGFIMTIVGCAFALAGSQIVAALYLTLATNIARELEAESLTLWILTAGIVAMGALAPFVGPLADMFGRKALLIAGLIISIIGAIACAATPNAGGFIAGQCLLGVGAVTQELLGISIVSEIVPTAKRSLYAAVVLCTMIPWSPAPLYANWIAVHSWRWIGCTVVAWDMLTMAIIAFFYRPPPRVNALGLSRKEMMARIDFFGGILMTTGLVFILIALDWGGQQYSWQSAQVLSFLMIGFGLLLGFGFWEWYGVQYPLFPRRIIFAPRPFFCLIFVIFAAGINFVPLVVFWPIQSISVYGSGRYQTGINSLPIGTSILGGGILSALLIGLFNRHITLLMTIFCAIQTIGCACLTIVNPHDIRTAFVPVILALIGVGGVLVPNQVIITVITPDDLIASVTALTVGLRAQAQVIGLAIFFNRFLSEVTVNAFTYVVPAMVKAGIYNATTIENMITGLTAVPFYEYAPLIPELRIAANYDLVLEATIQCFSRSFTLIYYITIAFGVPACIVAALMGDISAFLDNHVAVVL